MVGNLTYLNFIYGIISFSLVICMPPKWMKSVKNELFQYLINVKWNQIRSRVVVSLSLLLQRVSFYQVSSNSFMDYFELYTIVGLECIYINSSYWQWSQIESAFFVDFVKDLLVYVAVIQRSENTCSSFCGMTALEYYISRDKRTKLWFSLSENNDIILQPLNVWMHFISCVVN